MGTKSSVKVGEVYVSNSAEFYVVTDYKRSVKGVTIKFLSTGNSMVCSAKEVKNGNVKNPLQKSVYDVGCFGIGNYKAKICGKFTPEYQLWIGMMTRVYNEGMLESHPSYKSVTVCEEWLNFQNFANWCQDKLGFNRKESNGRAYMLDKDLLIPGNRSYSPDACCFLPHQVNVALKGRQSDKRSELPSGVYWHKASNGYIAATSKKGKQFHLGCFDSSEEAKEVFRKFKKEYFAELADEYKDVISEEAYLALKSFSFEGREIFNNVEE